MSFLQTKTGLSGNGIGEIRSGSQLTQWRSVIFQDAHEVHASALQKLAEGDVRDAAEKAWCATKRATDALILARAGEEPQTTAMPTEGLLALARQSADFETLAGRYSPVSATCTEPAFTMGCVGRTLSAGYGKTADYIRDAEDLAYR